MSTASASPPRSGGWWWREAALVAGVFAVTLLGGSFHSGDTLRSPPVAAIVLAAASALVVAARRPAPVAALIAATVCGMLAPPLGLLSTPVIVAGAIVCAYGVGLGTERRVAVVAACAVLLAAPAPLFEDPVSLSWEDATRLASVVAAPIVAAVLGRAARHRQRYVRLVEERAHRAEADREAEARRKVAEERLRIARELHDLVAHQITLANAQAAVAARLFDARGEQARASIDDVVSTTRQALDDLRAAVGFLRESDDDADAAHPAPGLSQVPALVASFARAGLEVHVAHEGTATGVSPAADLTAYRVVQEALTNVAKHSSAPRAHVHAAWGRAHLTLTVSDEGRARRPYGEHPPGYGIVGMRERVAAVGGELSARAQPGGGFAVVARLPLTPAGTASAPSPDSAADGGRPDDR